MGKLGAAEATDEFLGLAGEHGAADDLYSSLAMLLAGRIICHFLLIFLQKYKYVLKIAQILAFFLFVIRIWIKFAPNYGHIVYCTDSSR